LGLKYGHGNPTLSGRTDCAGNGRAWFARRELGPGDGRFGSRRTECQSERGTATGKLVVALPRSELGHGEAVEDQIDRLGN
jgi:hypothetical protein